MAGDPMLAVGFRGLACFQRLAGAHAPGGRVIEGEGWVGSVVPSAPDTSLLNAVVKLGDVDWPDLLAQAKDAYGAETKWGVWIHEGDAAGVSALEGAGLVLDSAPIAQAAALAEIAGLDEPVGEVEPIEMAELVAVNEAAWDVPAGKFAAGFGAAWPADVTKLYGARHEGAVASVLCCLWVGEDAHVTFVATRPQARGRGLATRLFGAALRDARAAGLTTTTLEASKAGAPVYNRLGYRDLGRALLYECRPSA